MRKYKLTAVISAFVLLVTSVLVPLSEGAQPPPYTRLISRSSGGSSGNSFSDRPSVSASGRYVAFQSDASDLVPNDTNNRVDIFVYDRNSSLLIRASVATGGVQVSDGDSINPAISPDGRYVVFESSATTLVLNDTNGRADIFLHELETGATSRINVGVGGAQATGGGSTTPHLSANADKIVYTSAATNLIPDDGNGFEDVFLYTRSNSATQRIVVSHNNPDIPPNGRSNTPYITANGLYVVFSSVASNLVEGDNNDHCGVFSCADIFVRDLTAQSTTLVNLNSEGEQADHASSMPVASEDARYVVFESEADNLDTVLTDTNLVNDIYLRDLATETTIRVSKSQSGEEGVFASIEPWISQDSNWITFTTGSAFLPDDSNFTPDVYRYERSNGNLVVASLPEGPGQSNGASREGVLSSDGQRVVFWSEATNLVPNDQNNVRDVYIRTYLEDDATPTPTLTPSNTATATIGPSATPLTPTMTPSPTVTPGGGPPTLTPTGSPVTRTPTATRTRIGGGSPTIFLPVLLRTPN